jgi:HK97 family phage major capsid protein
MRSKTIRPEVADALQIGTDSEGGYLVPDEYREALLLKHLEEENIFRKLAHVINTSSSGDSKIPVVASKGSVLLGLMKKELSLIVMMHSIKFLSVHINLEHFNQSFQ